MIDRLSCSSDKATVNRLSTRLKLLFWKATESVSYVFGAKMVWNRLFSLTVSRLTVSRLRAYRTDV